MFDLTHLKREPNEKLVENIPVLRCWTIDWVKAPNLVIKWVRDLRRSHFLITLLSYIVE